MTTASASARAPRAEPASFWILNSWRDLVLFIGTPVLALPIFLLARTEWTAAQIGLVVGSFGAMGHHLPGLMRAYGDRDLFRRFRLRFILAPLVIATLCMVSARWELSGVVLLTYLWGVWHGMGQTYGFARIYDAKIKSFDSLTARLDQGLCIAWFGAAVLFSPTRMTTLLDLLYRSRGPFLSAEWLDGLRLVWAIGTAGVTALVLANVVLRWRRARPLSPVKLLLLASSFAFFWYCSVMVDNIIVGNALFEVFHDVQYLSIVWLFNRSRVEKDQRVGIFTRFLFRRSAVLVGVYLGLVLLYGSLGYIGDGIPTTMLNNPLQNLIVLSALLHFYYDGFIWKVRERSTRESLGLEGGVEAAARPAVPLWLRHSLAWCVLLTPAVLLGMAEIGNRTSEIPRARAVAASLTRSSRAQGSYGLTLLHERLYQESIEQFRKAIAINPDDVVAHYNLAFALQAVGKPDDAIPHLVESLRIEPRDVKARVELGKLLAHAGRFDEAIADLQRATAIRPRDPEAQRTLGRVLASRGRLEEAITQYTEVLDRDPEDVTALLYLGDALAASGRPEDALPRYEQALKLRPGDQEALEKTVTARRQIGESSGSSPPP